MCHPKRLELNCIGDNVLLLIIVHLQLYFANRIDILVMVACTGGAVTRELTADGLEATMATNHFGHFLLVNRLIGE